jgi:2-C-methyl-D-erythritol 4-phosphate cytidylyltransferase
MRISVIIPAAGLGRRFTQNGEASKIEWPLAGKAVLLRAADLFLNRENVEQVLIAVPPDQLEAMRDRFGDRLGLLGAQLVAGGTVERWETVLRALDAVDEQATHIAVHDAARPLTSSTLLDRVFAAAAHYPAVIPATPIASTLKRVESTTPVADDQPSQAHEADPLDALLAGMSPHAAPSVKRIVETVARDQLVAAQTPQVFEAHLLRQAYAPLASGAAAPVGTDDASLVEALGQTVYAVQGETTNFKLTHPEDGELAEAILARREASGSADSQKRRFEEEDEDDVF